MDLAYSAGRAGGTMTGVLSAANEKAVELFISERYVVCILTFNFCTGACIYFKYLFC